MADPDDALVDAALAAPAPLLGAPPPGAQTGPVPQPEPQERQKPDGLQPKDFDPKWRDPFYGLVYLGRLTDEFVVWGHRFKIATPSHLERMEIGLIHAPYANTITTEVAFETALVAAYLQQIDGQDLPRPLSPDPKDTSLADRFRWVGDNLNRQVINAVYNRCLVLDEKVDGVLEAMGEASG